MKKPKDKLSIRVSHFWVIFPNHFASSRDECTSHSGTRKILVLYVLCLYLPAIFEFCVVQLHFCGKKNLLIKSSLNQLYYFWAIENILEFTCVTYMLHMYEYVYVTCVTYVMDNFIPNSVSIGFICLTFLHCAFSNVSSNRLPKKRHSHIGCICLSFLHCAFSNVSSNRLPNKRHSHIDCICLTFLRCVFSNVLKLSA